MATFIKRQCEIEAIQYKYPASNEFKEFAGKAFLSESARGFSFKPSALIDDILSPGTLAFCVSDGAWLIKDGDRMYCMETKLFDDRFVAQPTQEE